VIRGLTNTDVEDLQVSSRNTVGGRSECAKACGRNRRPRVTSFLQQTQEGTAGECIAAEGDLGDQVERNEVVEVRGIGRGP
jgi:hypothetical protein